MAYVVIARWLAREGNEALVADALRGLAPAARQEPACRFYQPSRDPADPRLFVILEIYDDERGYQAHLEAEHTQRYGFGLAIPALQSREREFYETLE
jgi:quinol monooxygenase YgiN